MIFENGADWGEGHDGGSHLHVITIGRLRGMSRSSYEHKTQDLELEAEDEVPSFFHIVLYYRNRFIHPLSLPVYPILPL